MGTHRPDTTRAAVQAAVFTPISPTGRAEAVAQRLADAISLGLLAPGERLPSESELGRQFGVATVTAREALESLRGGGLVHTRGGRGGGSFVRHDPHVGDTAIRGRLAATGRIELRDLGLHYAAIASAAAHEAAGFATAEEADSLLGLIDGYRDPALGTTPPTGVEARRAENTIRLETAALSRSARLVREQVRLQAEFGPLFALLLTDREVADQNLDRHRHVAEAIRATDGDAARSRVDLHIRWAVDKLAAARRLGHESTRERGPA